MVNCIQKRMKKTLRSIKFSLEHQNRLTLIDNLIKNDSIVIKKFNWKRSKLMSTRNKTLTESNFKPDANLHLILKLDSESVQQNYFRRFTWYQDRHLCTLLICMQNFIVFTIIQTCRLPWKWKDVTSVAKWLVTSTTKLSPLHTITGGPGICL